MPDQSEQVQVLRAALRLAQLHFKWLADNFGAEPDLAKFCSQFEGQCGLILQKTKGNHDL